MNGLRILKTNDSNPRFDNWFFQYRAIMNILSGRRKGETVKIRLGFFFLGLLYVSYLLHLILYSSDIMHLDFFSLTFFYLKPSCIASTRIRILTNIEHDIKMYSYKDSSVGSLTGIS